MGCEELYHCPMYFFVLFFFLFQIDTDSPFLSVIFNIRNHRRIIRMERSQSLASIFIISMPPVQELQTPHTVGYHVTARVQLNYGHLPRLGVR